MFQTTNQIYIYNIYICHGFSWLKPRLGLGARPSLATYGLQLGQAQRQLGAELLRIVILLTTLW